MLRILEVGLFGANKSRSVIQHPLNDELYQYRDGVRFDPGAPAESFEMLFALPAISFRGRARLAGAMRPLQPPQVYFSQQSGINGLGGLQAGQFVGAPLLDPEEL